MSSLTRSTLFTTYLLAMFSLRYALRLKSSRSFWTSVRTSTRLFSTTAGSNAPKEDTGHQSGFETPQLELRDQEFMEKLQKHQSTAPKLSVAEEIRNLVHASTGHGVLCTNSVQFPGYPTGSVVAFELDEDGLPFFSLSTMSAHTKELLTDKRSTLVVTANDFKTVAEGRIMMIGDITKVSVEEKARLRDRYLKRHKDSYWIDFGDFGFFKMEKIQLIRYVGGFARAGSVTGDEYLQAKVDPLIDFAAPVIKHMNEDHSDSTVAMIQHYVGVPVTEAAIVTLDRLGMTVKAKLAFADNGYSKIRLPFPREVTERKVVKEVLVEMTRASANAVENK